MTAPTIDYTIDFAIEYMAAAAERAALDAVDELVENNILFHTDVVGPPRYNDQTRTFKAHVSLRAIVDIDVPIQDLYSEFAEGESFTVEDIDKWLRYNGK